jgi:hypothetical protein
MTAEPAGGPRAGFDPRASLSPRIEIVEDALVIPWDPERRRGVTRPAGVLRADGSPVAAATCWRAPGLPTTTPPPPPPPGTEVAELPGTHLFAGLAYGHFGHFLCESTGRLWAADRGAEGIVFLPKRPKGREAAALAMAGPVLEAFGLGALPRRCLMRPTRVERLIVAPQGFGTGRMIEGAPEFRAFVAERLGAGIAPEGPERLYISRARLYAKRGGILAEAEIEARLAAEGYGIFHPQEHPIEVQIARYRAARLLVSTDNSALHLAALVQPRGARTAILLRRPGKLYRDFVRQFRRFAGEAPVIVDATDRFWFRAGARLQRNEMLGRPRLPAIGAALAAAGFVADGAWPELSDDRLAAAIAGVEARLGRPLEEVTP